MNERTDDSATQAFSLQQVKEARTTSAGQHRFRVLRPLEGGIGGMGVISIAKDEELGREVALKQIRREKANDAAYRAKFRLEGEITGNLEHPGIVPIYGLGMTGGGHPYYAMRLVRGDSLSTRIQAFHQERKAGNADYRSLDFHGLIDRLIDVGQAISYAHSRGVLHRDLKPVNILVGRFGETLVIDWGLARLSLEDATEKDHSIGSFLGSLQMPDMEGVPQTQHGTAVGTLGYAAPEQAAGLSEQVDDRSDVYSLGAILYEILTGVTPIRLDERSRDTIIADVIAGRVEPPHQIARRVPKPLDAVCMKALSTVPAHRYTSVNEFIAELERWKADQPIIAQRESFVDWILRLARHYRAATLAAVTALLAIAMVSIVATLLINHQRQKADTLANRNDFLVRQFIDAFRLPDPQNVQAGAEMRARDVLLQARQGLSSETSDAPG